MPEPNITIPPDVLEALRRGDLIGAIKLLRTKGMGLKEAKDILDSIRRNLPSPEARTGKPPPLPPAAGHLPPGEKIDVVQKLRERTGFGAQDAREAPASARQPRRARSDGLAPGEMPPENNVAWAVVLVLLAALGVYFFFGGR